LIQTGYNCDYPLSAQELQNKLAHFFRLFLLNPMTCTI
jgi:hypothetical protein